jgi:Protein of unknown function (DUF1420)
MALAASIGVLLATGLFAGLATLAGHRLLRLLDLESDSPSECLLTSAALGVICLEVLLFFAQLSAHIRIAILLVLAIELLFGVSECKRVAAKISGLARRCLDASRIEKLLLAITCVVLLLEGLAAMAPVTGSDALHYHFTAPLLILRSGFHPDFFLSHSFFTGQSHLLILMGLALGSSQLAMGLIFLGGVLAAAAGACLARRWVGREWAWTAALLFLLTPVAFWQISTAGAPDLWMAFFATAGVLVISRTREMFRMPHAILAGAFAGAVAGTKYTGCIIAASMAVAYFWEARSALKSLLFLAGSVAAGVYPYARNLIWTGDPVFPFLTRWLSPAKVNAYALASYLADTGASQHRSVWQILKSPFFVEISPSHLGFWQFLGPLVLALSPFLLLAVRNSPVWRTALTVWVLSALGIAASSGMARFLLPVLPIALAAILAGVAQLAPATWPVARKVSIASLAIFLAFAAAGFLVYERSALLVALGRESRDEYLRQQVQEFEKVEFINQVLAGKEEQGKALVFLRHLYYLRVPFVYGDPAASWAVDPSKFQTAEEWHAFFREQNIGWVVRSPNYPPAIAAPLQELEDRGELLPIAKRDVSDFNGMRISGRRDQVPVVIYSVKR